MPHTSVAITMIFHKMTKVLAWICKYINVLHNILTVLKIQYLDLTDGHKMYYLKKLKQVAQIKSALYLVHVDTKFQDSWPR